MSKSHKALLPLDSSRRGTREDRGLPHYGQPKVRGETFFSFSEPAKTPSGYKRKSKAFAPRGYAFNARGDLINLRREAQRRG